MNDDQKTHNQSDEEGDSVAVNPAVMALIEMFGHSSPLDNIAQARALVSFLKAVKCDDDTLDTEATYGQWLVLSLLSNLLEQAHHSIEKDTLRKPTKSKNLAAVGE